MKFYLTRLPWHWTCIKRAISGIVWLLFCLSAVSCSVTFEVHLLEESLPGIVVGNLSRYTQHFGSYELRQTDYSNYFAYNKETGIINTTRVIDRDVLSGLCINGSDFGTLLFEQSSKLNQVISVKVIIYDINDNAPEFSSTTITKTVPEESKIGDVVQLSPATDVDCGLNGTILHYTITEQVASDAFVLQFSSDKKSLNLVVNKKLDRESKEFYIFNISACDEGLPPRCNFSVLNVTVVDYNDNKPLFHIPSVVHIKEKCASGKDIVTLNVSDADSGNNAMVSLSIKNVFHSSTSESSELKKLFQIDSVSKKLMTNTCLTYDQAHPYYTVVIEAVDHGVPVLRNDVTIHVNVVDINDHCPVLKVYRFLPIKENEIRNSVGIIFATDKDNGENGNVTLEIVSGNPNNTFYLVRTKSDENTFTLKLNGTLDRETFAEYNITIQGFDHGEPPCNVTQSVVIPVTDVNDNIPTCLITPGEIFIAENSPVGSYVTVVHAVDEDMGKNSQIKYILPGPTKLFQIVESTGLVTTNDLLDYETHKSFELTVIVQDEGSPPLSSNCSITVNITDVNDNKPLFSNTTYNVAIPEDLSVGSPVLVLSATDPDIGRNSELTFNMLPASPVNKRTFSLNSKTGKIYTLMPLDRESCNFYHFVVMVNDQGDPPLSSTASVDITILDVNDNRPIFYPSNYYLNLFQNQTDGFIINITATDLDIGQNGNVFYKIIRNDPEDKLFHIDNKTGRITTTSVLNSTKMHQLKAVASDGQGMVSNISTIQVSVITIHDVLPSFDMDFYTFYIDENVEIGTYVGQVKAKINLSTKNISYLLHNGDAQHVFSINDMGEIRTIKEVDSEEQRKYKLQILAKTDGVRILIAWTTVIIHVNDMNDNAPEFQDPFQIVTIRSNILEGTVIYQAKAMDPDFGVAGIIKYELSCESDQVFGIDSQTGDITVKKDLSRLNNLRYLLKVIASDCGLPNLTSILHVTIDITKVNIIPPLFQSNCTFVPLARNAPVNQLFLNITASDPDGGTTSKVYFHLSAVGNGMGYFGIYPNGTMFVRQSLLNTKQSQFMLEVIATDTGHPPLKSAFYVNISLFNTTNNLALFKRKIYKFEVDENEKPGTLVAKVDFVGHYKHLVIALLNEHAYFSFDNVNYEIRTQTTLDRENVKCFAESCFRLYLQASYRDQPQLGVEVATIDIEVKDKNDNKPVFTLPKYVLHVQENKKTGTSILKLLTIDNDEGENSKVNFSLVTSSCLDAFLVNKSGFVVLHKSLENANISHCNLTVQVMNTAAPFFHSTTLIEITIDDVNNNPPKFAKPWVSIDVEENSPLGRTIFQVTASDKDAGRNSRLAYIISNGNSERVFKLDHETGKITLRRKLDFESKKNFTLNITTMDSGVPPLSSSQEIFVNVTDVNDNVPYFVKCMPELTILENVSVGTIIGECIANDVDSGHDGMVSYSISREKPRGDYFSIDSNNGTLSVKKPLDRERFQRHKVFITAQDNALPVTSRLSCTKAVTIILNDINDNAPLFTSPPAVVFDSAKKDDHLITLTAYDPDIGSNGQVIFKNGTGGDNHFFNLNSNGKVSVQNPLTRNCPYYINVIAIDLGNPQKKTFQQLTVFAMGANDLSFNQQTYSASIFENEPTGRNIVTVSTNSTNNIQYFITNDSSKGLVVLNSTTGVISTKVPLDREGRPGEQINLVAYAVDTSCSKPARTASVAVNITILDKNDNVPTFSEDVYVKDVSEAIKQNSKILALHCRDGDQGRSGSVSYQIAGGNSGHVFRINGTSGEIILSRELDYELNPSYVLNVTATDDGQPQLSSWSTVIINVLDVNDNAPVFTKTSYSFTVMENSPAGTVLGVIVANDADSKRNGEVFYHLSGDDSYLFSINANSGVLKTASMFDRENIPVYLIKVVASDLGVPRAQSSIDVYISILDENDNYPKFSDDQPLKVDVFENSPIGTSISTLKASDKDFGLNSKLNYFISGGNIDNAFSISSDGTIVTASLLDRERTAQYDIKVTVSDLAPVYSQRRFTTKSVLINVLDVNDEKPYFISASIIHLREDQKVGEPFTTVLAVDKDTGPNGQVQYDLQGSVANDIFQIDRYTGALSLKQTLDLESRRSGVINIAIEVKDRGQPANFLRRNFKVIIDDVNDNSPAFSPYQNQVTVYENKSIGTPLIQINASDVDQGHNGLVEYAITAGNVNNTFSIHPIDGIISLVKPLDRESLASYDLRIKAFDLGKPQMENSTVVHIIVLDVNDNPPHFQESHIKRQVKENSASILKLCTFVATDQDEGRNEEITYSIAAHETNVSFLEIDSNSGVVSLVSPLDRERKSSYSITIRARDNGVPQLFALAYLDITVDDENDNSPVFVKPNMKGRILEGSPVGSTLCVMNATDADIGRNGQITYELTNDFSHFKINSKTGEISTIAKLDRELLGSELHLVVKAKDGGNPQRETFGNVIGRIVDIDDNKAKFEKKKYTALIPLNSPNGTFVTVVLATDKDEGLNGKVVYAIKPQSSLFHIEPETGNILTKSTTSSMPGKWELKILALNAKTRNEDDVATVVITGTTGDFPVFKIRNKAFSISEDEKPGLVILRAEATDDPVFHIASGNVNDQFSLDFTSRNLTLNKELDYEKKTNYSLWLKASLNTDYSSYVNIQVFVVDVNDNKPIFQKPYYEASLQENLPSNITVATIIAEDNDSGQFGLVQYSIVETSARYWFRIDNSTGVIYTRKDIDREENSSFNFTVQAKDHGSPGKTNKVPVQVTIVDVNDNPPIFYKTVPVYVVENALPGLLITKVNAEDKDEHSRLTYELEKAGNSNQTFSIQPLTGEIKLQKRLDRETVPYYQLTVVVTDGKYTGKTLLNVIILDIDDNSPIFRKSLYTVQIPELSPVGSFVVRMNITDYDEAGPNTEVFYYFERSVVSDMFRIDYNGVITVAASLKFNTTKTESVVNPNQYNVTVFASNPSHQRKAKTTVCIVVIDANNHPPVFEKNGYFAYVPDVSKKGANVLTVKATDIYDVGKNSEVQYKIVGGNGTAYFEINSSTGHITVKSELTSFVDKMLLLKIQANDCGEPVHISTTNASVYITITVENKYSPVFEKEKYELTLPENYDVGKVFLRIKATDKDGGVNGKVSYRILPGNQSQHFTINQHDGSISIANVKLDYEERTKYVFEIEAKDGAHQPKSARKTVQVSVSDYNDNPPVFQLPSYKANILENSPNGSSVVVVHATDRDTIGNTITYTLLAHGKDKDTFTINKNTGEITTTSSIDYESKTVYQLTVLAMDSGRPQKTGDCQVVVSVIGVNEFTPKFPQETYTFTTREDSAIGHIIGTVTAKDDDEGYDGVILYEFVDPSRNGYFNINQTSGEIFVVGRLDSESIPRVKLTVLAKNPGDIVVNASNTDKIDIIINIEDSNDPPRFLQQFAKRNIDEDTPEGTQVANFTAVDDDIKAEYNSPFVYSILRGNLDNSFKLIRSGDLAIIITNKRLDREKIAIFNLTIAATDKNTPSLMGTATLIVELDDVNDNAPSIKPGICPGRVKENQPSGTLVVTFDAIDDDIDPNKGPFEFKIMNKGFVPFIINNKSQLKTTMPLDREKISSYNLTITVEDSGWPKLSSICYCEIIIEDINDNQPSAETRRVTVNVPKVGFNDLVIGDVSPVDADTVNVFSCEVEGTHYKETFSFQSGSCFLNANKPRLTFYALNVRARDELSNEVSYSLNISFNLIRDLANQRSVILRFFGISTQRFLSVMASIRCASGYVKQVLSIQQVSADVTDVLLVYLKNGAYIPKQELLDLLNKCKNSLNKQLGAKSIDINYDSCSSSNPCINGDCQPVVTLLPETRTTLYSKTNVFVSVYHRSSVNCLCHPGYTGTNCEYSSKPCSAKPCKNNGTCIPTGVSFMSFLCQCQSNYSGKLCDIPVNMCNQNPCSNTSVCVSGPEGPKCHCDFGGRGERCELSSIGFYPVSYMKLPTLASSNENKIYNISLQFATVQSNGLILFNQNGKNADDSRFIALEIIESRLHFSFSLGGSTTRLVADKYVADGQWHTVIAIKNKQVGYLNVDGSIFNSVGTEDEISFTEALDLHNSPLYLGGVPSLDIIFSNPGQVKSHDFVGCMRDVYFRETKLDTNKALVKFGVVPRCPRFPQVKCQDQKCRQGSSCVDKWFTGLCQCKTGICSQGSKQLTSGSVLRFQFDPDFLRENEFHERQIALRSRRRRTIEDVQTLSVSIRSRNIDAFLWRADDTLGNYTELLLNSGFVSLTSGKTGHHYHTKIISDLHIKIGRWYNITVVRRISSNALTLVVDNSRNETYPDQPYIFLGGTWTFGSLKQADDSVLTFDGCLSTITINGEVLSVNVTNQYGILTIEEGELADGCETPDFCSSNPCPGTSSVCRNEWATYRCAVAREPAGGLSVGAIAAIVFFVILVIAIVVAAIAVKKRRTRNLFAAALSKKTNVDGEQDNSGGSSSSDSTPSRKTLSRQSLDSGVEVHNTNASLSSREKSTSANVISLGSPDEYTIVTSRRDSGSDQGDTGFTDSECEFGVTNVGANLTISSIPSNVGSTHNQSKEPHSQRPTFNYNKKVPYLINRGYLMDPRRTSRSTTEASEEQESIEMQNYSIDIEEAENYSIGDASLATYSDLNFPSNAAQSWDADRIQRYRPSLERFSESDDSPDERQLSNLGDTFENLESGDVSSVSSDGGFTVSEYDYGRRPSYEENPPIEIGNVNRTPINHNSAAFNNINNESSVDGDMSWDVVNWGIKYNDLRNTCLAIAQLRDDEEDIEIV